MSDDAPPGPHTAPSAEEAARLEGTVISDRYRIVELVAMGGMGAVYRAEHLLLRKHLAIKVLHPQTKGFPEHVARFEREAIAGAHIQHPNIAPATDFGRLPDGSYFLVLEYVSGVRLDRLIAEGPLAAARAVEIARQIAAALAAAHERGVIHRDLKPRNVLLEQGLGDRVKVIDFGLAKVPVDRLATTDPRDDERRDGARLTLSGIVFGTVAYMAPEAALGMDAVDERSDLYALGIILYEMLCGRHPFDATEPAALFAQQRKATPPPLKLRAPGVDVPRALEALVMRLLRKDPAERFESARALIAALDAAVPNTESLGLISWKSPLPMAIAGAFTASDDALPLVAVPPPPAPGGRAAPHAPAWLPPPPPAGQAEGAPPPPSGLYRPRLRGTRPGSRLSAGVALAVLAALIASGAGAFVLLRASQRGAGPGAAAPAASVAAAPSAPPPPAAAAPTPSASADAPAAPEPPPLTARERLVLAVKAKDWAQAEDTALALIDAEPAVFVERDVTAAAAAVAVKSAFRADDRADRLFDGFTNRLGDAGLDVIYEILSAHGGTRGAERAAEILRRPEVRARASAALRIAFDLRETPCRLKGTLFDRAAREGDARSLVVLELFRSAQCQPRIGQCCFHNSPVLDQTISALRVRLRP